MLIEFLTLLLSRRNEEKGEKGSASSPCGGSVITSIILASLRFPFESLGINALGSSSTSYPMIPERWFRPR